MTLATMKGNNITWLSFCELLKGVPYTHTHVSTHTQVQPGSNESTNLKF